MANLFHIPTDHPHIIVAREPAVEPERRRGGSVRVKIPPRVRKDHAEDISTKTEAALEEIAKNREVSGMSADRFLVVEFESWSPEMRDTFEERFPATVMEERAQKEEFTAANGSPEDGEKHQAVVQFDTIQGAEDFRQEIERYGQDESKKTLMPPGLRTSFMNAIEDVRVVSPEERMGSRLLKEGWPQEPEIILDVDLWHPGNIADVPAIMSLLREACARYGGRVTDDTRTNTLLLARVKGSRELGEALLQIDFIARVDLPPRVEEAYLRLFDAIEPIPEEVQPTEDDPLVTVIDSGVLAGHPLLRGWVVEERDFGTDEESPVDRQGHGTQVAGLVVYGDIANCLENGHWIPKVRICSGKVLQRHPVSGAPVFPSNRRIESMVEEAIRYFHDQQGCRIFNLSLGSTDEIYGDHRRQFPWAELLDQLARDLDVVLIVSAGNRFQSPIPANARNRAQFQEAVRNKMLKDPAQRLCNPATSCLALTVGAIARTDNPRGPDLLAAVPADAPSSFSRVGMGYQWKPSRASIKPDLVAYGGNEVLKEVAGGSPRWGHDLYLGEPTLKLDITDRFVGVAIGTSIAAPHVSFDAAMAFKSLKQARGAEPSANAVRALLGACTFLPKCGERWLKDSQRKESSEKLRLVGYGACRSERLSASADHDTCLVAESQLQEDHWHVYALPVPADFLQWRGKRGMTVALAFDPPTRASRRQYLARTMWIEILKGVTLDEIESYRSKYMGKKENAPKLPGKTVVELRPSKTGLQWSTLQVRRKTWTRAPRWDGLGGEDASTLHALVGCQHRFPSGEESNRQGYAIAVRFWHEKEDVEIYQQLYSRVRLRARARLSDRS